MEIVQLNLALSTTPERIREPKFNTVKRGYDPSQVLEYLSKIADRMEVLESQVKELGSQLERANQERDEATTASAPDSYEQVTSRVAELMVGLDRDVARLRSEAEADAVKIREEARAEAQRVQSEAGEMNALARQTLADAEEEAGLATSRMVARQESVREELRAASNRVIQVIAELEASMEHQDGVIVVREPDDEAPTIHGPTEEALPEAPPAL
jgi:DivIVA domain-containing protein